METILKNRAVCEFINEKEILNSLEYANMHKSDSVLIDEILDKAMEMKGLSHRDACVLLKCNLEEKNSRIYEAAKKIKNSVYGRRVVIFAPLYISNYCVNGCLYCPFCFDNKNIARRKLTIEEIKDEAAAIIKMGHKRIALEAGEDPVNCTIDYVLDAIDAIYSTKVENGAIRRINVNIAATSIDSYKKLKEAGIGTYVLFQETYNKLVYERFHPKGPKHDYRYHTEAMDRAMQAGLDDVGCGVLFGLASYDYEFAGLLLHAKHLEESYGVGPHTISVPRIKAADGVIVEKFKYGIDDETFLKLIACIRLAVPYTGIIVSTRENESLRAKALNIGISQISAGSLTTVGGYGKLKKNSENSSQFETSDKRSLDEIVNWLLKFNLIPSFCTSCYRNKRVGADFMKFSKACNIHNFCQPNAILTLKEYLNDYALSETRDIGERLINFEIEKINNSLVKEKIKNYIELINSGKRDFNL